MGWACPDVAFIHMLQTLPLSFSRILSFSIILAADHPISGQEIETNPYPISFPPLQLWFSVLSRGQDFYQRRNGLGLISWAKRQGLYWKNIGPRSELQYGPSAASSAQKRPRADQFPLYGSQASLVNKRFQYYTTEDVKKKIPLSRTVKTPYRHTQFWLTVDLAFTHV